MVLMTNLRIGSICQQLHVKAAVLSLASVSFFRYSNVFDKEHTSESNWCKSFKSSGSFSSINGTNKDA